MANGNTLVFKYDFYGRIIQAITGDGRFVNYQYDSYGDLITVTLPDSSQEQFQYQHYTFTTNSTTYHRFDAPHQSGHQTQRAHRGQRL